MKWALGQTLVTIHLHCDNISFLESLHTTLAMAGGIIASYGEATVLSLAPSDPPFAPMQRRKNYLPLLTGIISLPIITAWW